MTPSPGHRKCTAYRWPGLGGTPLALPLTEGLAVSFVWQARHVFPDYSSSFGTLPPFSASFCRTVL